MYISLASGNTSSNRKPEKRGVKSVERHAEWRGGGEAAGRQAQTKSRTKAEIEE